MSDHPRDDQADAADDQVLELADFSVAPDAALAGRVTRSINRHLLAADALELSCDIFVRTAWSHLRTLIESFPGLGRDPGEAPEEPSHD